MQDSFLNIYKILNVLQNSFVLIKAKSLLKKLSIFLKTSDHLVKGPS